MVNRHTYPPIMSKPSRNPSLVGVHVFQTQAGDFDVRGLLARIPFAQGILSGHEELELVCHNVKILESNGTVL